MFGNSFTVTTALEVVTDGQVGELITQVYMPAWANVSEAMLNVGLVSPVKSVAPKYHWYVIPVPVAVTFNVKASPTHFIVVAAGGVVIAMPWFITTCTGIVVTAGTHAPLI
jgi:FtsP/CotA-like multicopper oxidase with cupredoxin domain